MTKFEFIFDFFFHFDFYLWHNQFKKNHLLLTVLIILFNCDLCVLKRFVSFSFSFKNLQQ